MKFRTCIFVCGFTFLFAVTAGSASGQQRSLLEKPLVDLMSQGRHHALTSANTTGELSLMLSLPPRNEDALDAFLQTVSDPASPLYRHYLTNEQFTSLYGPTEQDYESIVRWAQSQSLTVTDLPTNRRFVGVKGTIAKINNAFNIHLTNYVDDDSGRTFFAPDIEPTPNTPVQLSAIAGLDTIVPHTTHAVRRESAYVTSTNQANQGSGPSGSYTPSDMRAAYYGSGGLNGSGQSVAIFSYNGYNTADLTSYYSSIGMTSSIPVQNELVGGYSGVCTGTQGTGPCDDLEQVIDIANVAGMAPGLQNIYFYEGSSSTQVLNQIVTDGLASVVSSSWSGGDFGNASESIFKQMQADGISYVNAVGDNGAFPVNGPVPPPPALSPSIVQVGGTDLSTTSPGGSYQSESAWNDGGGGWVVNTFSLPSFQQSVSNSTNDASTTWRNSPDVAAEANFDNSAESNGVFYPSGWGGTSYATPRWAGILAMANQQAASYCESNVGFIAPALYATLNTSTYNTIFHDVTTGSNGYSAVSGYDLATGLGSPSGPNLINLLAPVQSTATRTTISVSLGSSPTTTFSARITNASGNPVPNGEVAFTYVPASGGITTHACGAPTINGSASCTAQTYTNKTGTRYNITATYTQSYGGVSYCQTSSQTVTLVSENPGFAQ